MRKTILFIALFILTIAAVSGLIGHIYPDRVKSGESADLIITFFNHGDSKERDLQASLYIPDLDVYDKGREFDLKSGTSGKTHFLVDVSEDIEPDYYPVVVMLEGEDGQYERTHSWIQIYK